jgi:GAF domain-containing protein
MSLDHSPIRDVKRLAALAETHLSADADVAFDRFARMVRRQLQAPVALVSLVDDCRQFFPGAAGLAEPVASTRETPLSHSICQTVVATGQPLIVTDVREAPELAGNLAITELGVVGYAGMPLTDEHGFVLGSLCAIDTEPHAWSAEEVETLADLAAACSSELRLRTAASAAHRADAAAVKSAQRVALAAEATLILSSTLDVDLALEALSELLVPRFADWAVVSLIADDGSVRQLAHRHRDGRQAEMARFGELLATARTPNSPTQLVLDGAPAQLIPALSSVRVAESSTDPEMAELVDRLGRSSYLVVPLTARGRTLGAIGLASATPSRVFSPTDLEVAVDLGTRAGLAIDNARLYSAQRRVAEVLQRSMLTDLPTPPGLSVEARYHASADDAQVGGDWYDAFLQPDGSTVLVIGDVMGHDSNAAAQMGQLRNLLRGSAYDRDASPALILTQVDAAIHGLAIDALATCVVVRIAAPDPRAPQAPRHLQWSNAGHPPPILVDTTGHATRLDAQPDLMLGVDVCAPRHDESADLVEGATLLLFTDGLVERRSLSLDEGLTDLTDTLRAHGQTPLGDACDQILTALLPQGASDDVALIAARAEWPRG